MLRKFSQHFPNGENHKAKKMKFTQILSDDTKKLIYGYLTKNNVEEITSNAALIPNVDQTNLLKNLSSYGSKKKIIYFDFKNSTIQLTDEMQIEWLTHDELYIFGHSHRTDGFVKDAYRWIRILIETIRTHQTKELVMERLPTKLIPLYLATFNPENGNSYKKRKVIINSGHFTYGFPSLLNPPHPWEFEFHQPHWSLYTPLYERLFGYEKFHFTMKNDELGHLYDSILKNLNHIHKWKNHQIHLVFTFKDPDYQYQFQKIVYLLPKIQNLFDSHGVDFEFSSLSFGFDFTDKAEFQMDVIQILDLIRFKKGIFHTTYIGEKKPEWIQEKEIPLITNLIRRFYEKTQQPVEIETNYSYLISYYVNIVDKANVPFIVVIPRNAFLGERINMENYYLETWAQLPMFKKATVDFNIDDCKWGFEKCQNVFLSVFKSFYSPQFHVTRDAQNILRYNIVPTK